MFHTYDGHLITKYGLQFVTLTFFRSTELRAATWDEIGFERKEWRVPADRMKMGADHIVPLSPAVHVEFDKASVNLLLTARPVATRSGAST